MAFNIELNDGIEVKEELIEDEVYTWETAEHDKLEDDNLVETDSKSAKISKSKKRTWWSDSDTQVLLDVWAERADDLRRVKRNGHIFQEMAVQMNNKFSAAEVHVKIRNLTQRYREEKKEILACDGTSSNWIYYNTVDKIIGSFAVNNDKVMETYLLENTSDASCQSSPETQPLPSSSPSPLPPVDATPTLAAAAVPSSGKKRNHLGELIKAIKEQNVILNHVVEDSKSLSNVILNAIRQQNENAKEFAGLMKILIDKI